MMKNLITPNPGFEAQVWNSTIRCSSGTATSCVDEDQYSGWPAGFWNGATYQIFYGAAAGRSGTITYSSAAGYGVGGTFTFGDSGTAPAAGDYMIVHMKIPGGSTGGWFPSVYGNATISDNTADLPPGTLGTQTTKLTAPTAADLAILSTYFDTTVGHTFVQLNGTYQLQFKAKALSGSGQIGIQLSRANGATFINETVNLSNTWNTYNVTFSAAENGSAIGNVGLQFSTVFGADSFELDDVSLTQTNGDPTNPTVFRDAVVNTLRTLQPGVLRFWNGDGQLGETLDNLITPQFGRQRAGNSEYSTEANSIDYGLHEFLLLCQTVGAEPWFVVPTTFSSTDVTNLMQYLAGASTTTYGAKRAALGQTAPWTSVFSTIHLEFGNEAWNSTFQGGSIQYSAPYGTQAQTVFGLMQSYISTNGLATNFDYVLGGQAASPGLNIAIQSYCNNNTSFAIAPYTMGTIDSYSDNESLFGSTFAEPEAYMSSASTTSAEGLSPGMVYQDYQAIQQSQHPVPLNFYEMNMGTLGGGITSNPAALNSYTPSLGAGLMVADTMLQGLKQFGIVNQNLYALPQYSLTLTLASGQTDNVLLFGSVVDMGVTNQRRPQYLAEDLANQALSNGAVLLQTTHSGGPGADPTWSESTVTNTVQFTNAHYLQSYAFQQGTSFSLVIFNFSRTAGSSLPVTFSGNAPTGTVQVQQLTSANLTDTNENSEVMNLSSSILTNFNPAAGLSLPAYSMTVLTWSTSTSAPVISKVSVSAITQTTATVNWTTDQLTSSLVNYGTNGSLTSSSGVNADPVTTHSVTLTGLTPGTTYSYNAVSANTATPALSSTSATLTFSTQFPAPVISAINITGVTPTSVTINWTTDQASDSELSYTASTSSTAATILNSTLVTTHSVTLTGLSNGTSYTFAITSANSAGTPATSSGLTFATLGTPVISSVSSSGLTTTSVTINWITDQASTSRVFYGTTTGYGSASSLNSSLLTTHSVTLTGLTPNTAYNYQVTSTNSYGLSTNSANFTFTTPTQGPVVSYVLVTSITNTSATITWTTDQASSSQVNYGTTSAYGSSSTLNPAMVTSHSVALSGLTLGTTYNFAVVSTDTSGITTTSPNFSFTTLGGTATTNIAIGSTVLQPSVKRLGINLGTLNNYDSGQITKNMITQNPGFQGQIWNSIIQCASGTATACVDQNAYSSWPANFWNGASYQFFAGAASGRSGTVYNSTAPAGGQGVTLNFADSGIVPQAGDYVIVRKTMPGGSTGGWFTSTSPAATVGDNLTDLPPGSQATQTTILTAPGSSDYASIMAVFDAPSGIPFVQFNGTYQVQFQAKGLTGGSQIGVLLSRDGGSTFINQTVALTNSWATYTLSFSGTENGSAVGQVSLRFSTVYGADSLELANASLTQTNTDPTNPTGFKDSVVTALRTLQPGILRYWGGNGQLGETLNNLLTPQSARQRAGYLESSSQSNQIDYGLHDFLVLCQTLGAEPWFVVPSTFSTTDASNLIQYLAGATTTTYGAKRAALGQSTPWTQVFSKIHLEFGEQEWNTAFSGGSIPSASAYGGLAQTIFAAMQANPAYAAGSFDLVLGGEAASPSLNTAIQSYCNNNTSFDIAPYEMNNVTSYSTNEALFGSTFAEPEAFMSALGTAEGLTQGMVYENYQAVQTSSPTMPLSFSEINLSTLGGTITQQALNSYTSSLGAGLAVADTMLQALAQFGIVNQNLYALPQYEQTRYDGSTVFLSGSVVDMGVTNRKRPQFLALQLANQALSTGATMLQTVQAGANPTWDEPLTNTVYFYGAHYLQSYAFQQGTNLSTVIFNLSRSSALPVTFSGINEPTGTVQMQQLTSANVTDTNESSNVVAITSSTLSNFNGASGLSLPPYSMTVLTWSSQNSPQAPVITAVMASSITGTSATITWTTDQQSSSLVNYGTSTGYGSSSALNSTLSTTHSATVTGLLPGTTYDFAAVSSDSSGYEATSANFTFTTVAQPPVISAVTATNITATSATITWTTDQASSSQVNYGTTTGYGTSSMLSSTLVMSHSVILTGLAPGTTYDYAAVSAVSAGNSATSTNFTFATNPQAPVISAVTATTITATSATITWTTDQASSSLVNYGTTNSYGTSSTPNAALVMTHSVTLTGLTAGTTYDYDVVSANSAGNSATSLNFTFATIAQAPVISAVTATSITATSATITWTTDQLSSSLVNDGTTTAYGSSSTLSSSLVTSHSVILTGLTPGTLYDFVVVSANSAGNSATSANFTFTTTTQPPVITAVTATNITGTTVTITWTTDQGSSSQVSYGTTTAYGTYSTVSATLVTAHSVTLTGLAPGTPYDYAVISENAAGSAATSPNFTFTTAAQPPVITLVTATSITGTTATITWTTDQPSSSLVNYGTTSGYGSSSTLNSALVTSHSVTLTGLLPGTPYDYAVVSANAAGNSATSSNFTFTTAAQAPVITLVTATNITGTSVTITWTTDQASSSLVNYGTTTAYGSSSTLNSMLVTSHSVTLTGLLPGTPYDYVVVSANSAGNSATSTNSTFTTAAQPPVITLVSATSSTGTTATITWTTDQPSSSLVNYGLTTAYGSSSTLNTTLVTSHSATLTGLTPGTPYDYVVVSANSAGNSATSANFTFTSAAQPPVITAVTATNVTSTSATITWTTDQPSSSLVNYGTTTAYGSSSTLNPALVTSHSVTLNGLTTGTYNYEVVSANSAGNSATSANFTFATGSQAPVITLVTAINITGTSATITWTTDQQSSSLVNYGTTTGYGSSSGLNSALVTSHSVTLTGLLPGTLYDYVVVSASSVGNSSTSANFTFTTAAQPPVITVVTATSITGMTATITWTTDQPSSSLVNYGTTTGYGSSSGLNSALVTSHSVTLTGLLPGTLYDYVAVSANSAGNTATSGNFTFTTAAQPPVITAVTAGSITVTSATITWTTDQPSSSLVNYGTTTGYGSSSTLNSALVTSHSVTLTGLVPGTTYDYVVVSANSAGNSATSPNSTFAAAAGATSTAAYIGLDTTTQGTWTGSYGADGYIIANGVSSVPTYATASLSGQNAWTWSTTTTDPRALQTSSGSSSRIASTYYASSTFSINVDLTDGNTHRVSLYLLDWDSGNRVETVSILNASNNAVLNSQTLSGFQNGEYASWNLTGNVIIQITLNSGENAALAAIFFGGVSTVPPVISAVGATNLGTTSATITWITDQASSSQVNYGTTMSYGTSSALNSALVTSHSVTLTGLTPGMTYDYQVVSANAGGYSTTSANFTFTTPTMSVSTGAAYIGLDSTTQGAWTGNYGQDGYIIANDISNAPAYATVSFTGQNAWTWASSTSDPRALQVSSGATTGIASTYYAASTFSINVNLTDGNAHRISLYLLDWDSGSRVETVSILNAANNAVLSTQKFSGFTNGQYGSWNVSGNVIVQVTLNSGENAVLAGIFFGGGSTSGPIISSVTATSITGTSATITWTTSQSASSLVNYGTTTSYGSASTLNSTLVTSHSVTLTGLTPGTLYDYDVVSVNSTSNSATSANFSFTTAAQPPVISAVTATSITSNSVTIKWTTDQPSSSLVNYGTTTGYGSSSTPNSTLVTSHSVTLIGLTPSMTYNYDVVSANSAGNTATSGNYSFATTAPGPVISSVTTATISATAATITWITDQSSSSLVEYGTTNSYGSSSTLNPALTTIHSVTLTGLTPGTLYDYAAVSANSAGTSSTSSNFTFTTAAQPPVISAVTATSITSSSATITWTTDQPSSSLVNYGTTTAYGTSSTLNSALVTSHSVTLTGLAPSTPYDYDVVSANAAGNTATSVNSTFSTASGGSVGATYGGLDTTTQGTWTGAYGADGYIIANDVSNAPAYATVSFTGQSTWTWANPTSDPRALQVSSGASSGIASTYYAASTFNINVNLTDGNSHRISLYLLDWDTTGRAETISILNAATNAVLNTQTFSGFHNGQWASWTVTGNVIVQVTVTGGENAVLAGIFFGAGAAPAATVAYGGLDTTTQGTWTGNYGADGYVIANDTSNLPAYATLSFTGQNTWTWVNPSLDPRALQISSGSSNRIASTYYGNSFNISLNLSDGNTHRVALYLLDWDTTARAETVTILDAATRLTLNTQAYSSFQNGEYAYWNIKGNVIIQVTMTSGQNAVVAGIFFK